jgi:hypothetical protein
MDFNTYKKAVFGTVWIIAKEAKGMPIRQQ